MPRPPLDIGTYGSIAATQLSPGNDKNGDPLPLRWRARARFRDADGVTRPVERWADTKARAIKDLKKALADRAEVIHGRILTDSTRFRVAADLWMQRQKTEIADTSCDKHEMNLRLHILPFLGELLLRECGVPALQAHLTFLAREKPEGHGLKANSLRSVRQALSGVLGLATEHGAISHNPVADLRQIRGAGKRPKSLSMDQVRELLAVLDSSPRRTELAAMVRFALGTGCRVSEIVGLRWCDVNLSDRDMVSVDDEQRIPPGHIYIEGNVVRVRGKGLVRHGGKTFAAKRLIPLPEYLKIMLALRRDIDTVDDEPVFPSPRTLGWRHPGGVSVSLAYITKAEGLPNIASHIFRRTAGTVLDDAGLSARQIADVLGHADPSFTQRVYLGRGQTNPAAAMALDAAYGAPPSV